MHCKCIFHRCKEACNVLKSGWAITSIFHHWSRTKFIRLWQLVICDMWLKSSCCGMLLQWFHWEHMAWDKLRGRTCLMSRAGSRLRRLESCTALCRPCPCEDWTLGFWWNILAWAEHYHCDSQTSTRRYSGEITGARQQHDAVLVRFSSPLHWVLVELILLQQSRIMWTTWALNAIIHATQVILTMHDDTWYNLP